MPRHTVTDQLTRELGSSIRKRREQVGETLEEVAHRIPRMDAKYLAAIERGGHSPTIPTVKRIAEALDISLSELLKDL